MCRQLDTSLWSTFSHENITRAEQERQASHNLRNIIDNVLRDIARDMRSQADNVELAFHERINQMHESITEITNQLQQV